jgi:hypothetical protein
MRRCSKGIVWFSWHSSSIYEGYTKSLSARLRRVAPRDRVVRCISFSGKLASERQANRSTLSRSTARVWHKALTRSLATIELWRSRLEPRCICSATKLTWPRNSNTSPLLLTAERGHSWALGSLGHACLQNYVVLEELPLQLSFQSSTLNASSCRHLTRKAHLR